jgi:hypothetical protein
MGSRQYLRVRLVSCGCFDRQMCDEITNIMSAKANFEVLLNPFEEELHAPVPPTNLRKLEGRSIMAVFEL